MSGTSTHRAGALTLALVLAVALSTVPLGRWASRLSAPSQPGAGVSAPVQLVWDGGSRLPVAGPGVVDRSGPPTSAVRLAGAPRGAEMQYAGAPPPTAAASERLATLGRRQLEGG